jgi:hypothetical protein
MVSISNFYGVAEIVAAAVPLLEMPTTGQENRRTIARHRGHTRVRAAW